MSFAYLFLVCPLLFLQIENMMTHNFKGLNTSQFGTCCQWLFFESGVRLRVLAFIAASNNISDISWRSVVLV